ncbi:MAG: pyridoxamine 5'-phosphate oxidase family protein [Clostridiales bacterium]|nr:pyridoxamine 5'-phosphate oxidase family protein [Clostridiales bacterium]
MKFSENKELSFEEAAAIMFEKLGTDKIMALASSVNDYVMVRNVSCLFYDGKIWFKTDKNFRKTRQLFENPNVALCWSGVQVEGTAKNCGLVVEEPGRVFKKAYKQYLWGSYNKYSHEDSEIIIEVTPRYVEVWDTSEDGYAYQIFIDFEHHAVEVKPYDQKGQERKI